MSILMCNTFLSLKKDKKIKKLDYVNNSFKYSINWFSIKMQLLSLVQMNYILFFNLFKLIGESGMFSILFKMFQSP